MPPEDFRQQIHFRSIVRLEQFTPMCPKKKFYYEKKEGDFTLFFSYYPIYPFMIPRLLLRTNMIISSLSLEAGISASILFDSIGVVKTRLIKNAVNILDFINFLV